MRILIFLTLFTAHLGHAESVSIDEDKLIELSKENNYQRKQFDLQIQSSETELNADDARFQTQFYAKAAYADSDEEALIQFAPTLGPTNEVSLGIQRQSGWGGSYQIEIFGEQVSAADPTIGIDRATRGGYSVSLEMDLLKNWMGAMDRDTRQSLDQQLRESGQYRQLYSHQYEYELRKVYWSLVANDRSMQITRKLQQTAKEQLDDLTERQKAGVASMGDVSRAQAQLESRKTSMLLLRHQRLALEKAIQQMVPSLVGKKVELAKVDYSQISYQVLMCITKIKEFPKYEKDWTAYSAILDAKKTKYEADIRQANKTAGADLKLGLMYQKSNADNNYDKAFSDPMNQGVGASLQFTVPIGSTDNKLREAQRAVLTSAYDVEREKLQNLLQSEHQQINGSLELLIEGLAALERNNRFLKLSVDDMQKKYRQARIGLPTLIREQEAHFNSSMREIDVRLRVIQSLLDYFKVFDRFPCEVNHIRSAS